MPFTLFIKYNAIEKNYKLNLFAQLTSKYNLPINEAVKRRLDDMEKTGKESEPVPSNPNPYPHHPYITYLLILMKK